MSVQKMKKKIWVFLCILLAFYTIYGPRAQLAWGNNLRRNTSLTVSVGTMPVYTGKGVVPEEFAEVHVFTDLDNPEKTEVTGLSISYSFYRYRLDRPYGPDESYDKLDWDETPSKVGTYWMKAKFLGDNNYGPSSSDYCLFQVVPAPPVLNLYTDMTEDTCIGDTVLVTAEFQGAETEPEDFQPAGTAIFQAGSRFIDQAVPFYGNKAQVSYTLTTEPVDITVQYHPGEDADSYSKAEAILKNVMGSKRKQDRLAIAGEPVAYGVEPYVISVSGGSGTGALTYESGNNEIAEINEKGKITIHHPGTVDIRVTKAEDDTYEQAIATYQLAVSKGINPDKPKIPVLMETTDSEIRVKKTSGQEFSIDGGDTWNTEGVFKELKAKKNYTVITRLTETELYLPGRSTKFLQVTTEAKTPRVTNTPKPTKPASSGNKKTRQTEGVNSKAEIGGSNGEGKSGTVSTNQTGASGATLAPSSSSQSRQWNSLGGSSSQTGTSQDRAVSKNTFAVEQTGQKSEKAQGEVKGVQAGQGSKQGAKEQTQEQEEPNQEAEEEPAPQENQQDEDGGEQDNKIVATGAARPAKRGISLVKIVVVLAMILLAAAGTGLLIWSRKRRNNYEKYRNYIGQFFSRKRHREDLL